MMEFRKYTNNVTLQTISSACIFMFKNLPWGFVNIRFIIIR